MGTSMGIISLGRLADSAVTRYVFQASKLQEIFTSEKYAFRDPSSASVFFPDLKVIVRCFHRNPKTSLKYKRIGFGDWSCGFILTTYYKSS